MHWIISKAIYTLIIVLQEEFGNIRHVIVSSQTKYNHSEEAQQRAARLSASLDSLLSNIVISVDDGTKDKFTTNLSNFRQDVMEYVDVKSLSKAFLEFVG
jgi:hypothetical protein